MPHVIFIFVMLLPLLKIYLFISPGSEMAPPRPLVQIMGRARTSSSGKKKVRRDNSSAPGNPLALSPNSQTQLHLHSRPLCCCCFPLVTHFRFRCLLLCPVLVAALSRPTSVPQLLLLFDFIAMTPTPKEAVAKVAQVASGTTSSAKDFKKESTTARLLGAGQCTAMSVLLRVIDDC